MARLFGFLGNRPDLGVKILEAESSLFEAKSAGRPLGWGVGYFQGDEVLLRRRPLDERTVIPFADVLRDVRTDALLGHVRLATIGSLRTENTHPFRFRQWLFAHTGTLANFGVIRERLLNSLPEFLRRNLRGDTDSEVLFHVFLSFLHDGGKLQLGQVNPADTRSALRSSLDLVQRLSAEEGVTESGCNLLVTNGESMVGVHDRGGPFAYRALLGRQDLESLLGEDSLRKIRLPDMASCRFCSVAADFDGELPGHFTGINDRSILTVTRTSDPVVEALLSSHALSERCWQRSTDACSWLPRWLLAHHGRVAAGCSAIR